MTDEPRNDDERDRYETPVLRVLQTFKNEAMPTMTEEEGGWLLGQILDIVEQARAAETLVAERARPPAAAVDPATYIRTGARLSGCAWRCWSDLDTPDITKYCSHCVMIAEAMSEAVRAALAAPREDSEPRPQAPTPAEPSPAVWTNPDVTPAEMQRALARAILCDRRVRVVPMVDHPEPMTRMVEMDTPHRST